MKKQYTNEETAAFRAKRREATRGFKKAMNGRGRVIEIKYPDTATKTQRGFVEAGSAALHFEGMRKIGNIRPSAMIQKSCRKPTGGSKHILQVITHKNGKLLVQLVNVPDRKNKAGDVIGSAFSYQKPKPIFLHLERAPRNIKPLF